MISETTRNLFAVGVALAYVAFVFLLTRWGRRVAARRGTRAWRLASWLPLTGFGIGILGIAGTAYELVAAFGAVAHIDPSTRATRLADGIRMAMGSTVLGMGLALCLYVASIAAFWIGGRPPPHAVTSADRDPS